MATDLIEPPARVGQATAPRPLDTPVVLDVRDLKTHFALTGGTVRAVDGVSYTLHRSRTLGIVGESGCGKSVTAQSVLGIVPRPGKNVGGTVTLTRRDGTNLELTSLDPRGKEIRAIRGNEIAYIFQEPMSALSPIHTIGHQITEVIRLHLGASNDEARARAESVMRQVGLPRPDAVLDRYPHQLSGGMRQRAVIGIALACNPSVLIADEPTTALDVTTEAVILDLVRSLQDQNGMAIQFITHNLGVIAEIADEVVVMYMGRQVERAPVTELFRAPQHPYTQALLRSMPRLGRRAHERLEAIQGMVPDPFSVPPGCAFHTRCRHYVQGTCDTPEYREVAPRHWVRCSRAGEVS